jgi:hypothetical protein
MAPAFVQVHAAIEIAKCMFAHTSGYDDNEHICTTVVTEPTSLLSFLYIGDVQLADKPAKMLFAPNSFSQIVSKMFKYRYAARFCT